MSSGERPDRGALTPQEWNRLTESLVSLSAVVTSTVSGVHKSSDESNERISQDDVKK